MRDNEDMWEELRKLKARSNWGEFEDPKLELILDLHTRLKRIESLLIEEDSREFIPEDDTKWWKNL